MKHYCFSDLANVLSDCFKSLLFGLAVIGIFIFSTSKWAGTSVLTIIFSINQWPSSLVLCSHLTKGSPLPWRSHTPERQLVELQCSFIPIVTKLPVLKNSFDRGVAQKMDPETLCVCVPVTGSRAVSVGILGTAWGSWGHLWSKGSEKIQKIESNSCSSFGYRGAKAVPLTSV